MKNEYNYKIFKFLESLGKTLMETSIIYHIYQLKLRFLRYVISLEFAFLSLIKHFLSFLFFIK